MEMGHLEEWETPKLEQIRAAFEARSHETGSLRERMSLIPFGLAAMDRVMEYSHRLHLHRSTGSQTTLEVITNAVRDVAQRTGEPPLIVVDYLQKVKVPNSADLSEDARVTVVVEDLKDLAIHSEAPVLAIVAGDKDGLGEGKRMRARHMRGSTALAYECDTLLILNGKHNIVAKHHLTYDLSAFERFREWVIVTIEKNRMGKDGVDLEFKKRFDQSRFDALSGGRCGEQLVDERVFTE